MVLVEIGANAFEVQDNGKCLFSGTEDKCKAYLADNFVVPEAQKPKPKTRKKKVVKPKSVIEGGDA